MPKRRKLGTVYEVTPAQQTRNWIMENIGKFFFAVVVSIIWIMVFYVVLGIVAFLTFNLGFSDKEVDARSLMQSPNSTAVIIVGIVLISLYVFRDAMGKKKRKL